jgi:hypothetical protein
MRATCILLLAACAACMNVEKKLDDLLWGQDYEADYDVIVERARYVLDQEFRAGLDPDKTNEVEGDFWTLWDYKTSMWYRETTRRRAHVKVEDAGDGMVRVGVSVVTQINDNIDNPHSIEDARWVRTTVDAEWSTRIEEKIGRRYLKAEPSEAWKEKHREEKRKGLRPDLVDRYRDVDLGESEPGDTPPQPKRDE